MGVVHMLHDIISSRRAIDKNVNVTVVHYEHLQCDKPRHNSVRSCNSLHLRGNKSKNNVTEKWRTASSPLT